MKKNKNKDIKKGLVFFMASIFLLHACESTGKIVKFSDLYSYMEASIEKDGHLVFRALFVAKSFTVVTEYRLYEKPDREGIKYFISLYEEQGDKKPSFGIQYSQWGGIEIRVPIRSFNSSKDKLYFRDNNGEYEIKIGTKESWEEYLKTKRINIK